MSYTRNHGRYWVSRYVDGLARRSEILPGAADKIADMVFSGPRAEYTPAGAMRRLGLLLADPAAVARNQAEARGRFAASGFPVAATATPDPDAGKARVFLNVERPAPEKPESALRATIRRFGLSDHHVAALHDLEAVNVAGLDEALLPSRVVELLTSDTHKHRQPWPLDPLSTVGVRIQHVIAGLQDQGEIKRDFSAEGTARNWESEHGMMNAHSYERVKDMVLARFQGDKSSWVHADFKPDHNHPGLQPPPPTEAEIQVRESMRAFVGAQI